MNIGNENHRVSLQKRDFISTALYFENAFQFARSKSAARFDRSTVKTVLKTQIGRRQYKSHAKTKTHGDAGRQKTKIGRSSGRRY